MSRAGERREAGAPLGRGYCSEPCQRWRWLGPRRRGCGAERQVGRWVSWNRKTGTKADTTKGNRKGAWSGKNTPRSFWPQLFICADEETPIPGEWAGLPPLSQQLSLWPSLGASWPPIQDSFYPPRWKTRTGGGPSMQWRKSTEKGGLRKWERRERERGGWVLKKMEASQGGMGRKWSQVNKRTEQCRG